MSRWRVSRSTRDLRSSRLHAWPGDDTDEGAHTPTSVASAIAPSDTHDLVVAQVTKLFLRGLAAERSGRALTSNLLATVAESLEWDFAALWLPDRMAERLRCDATWTLAPLQRFEAATRAALFPLGVGLPGEVWESGEPLWIENVAHSPNFVRVRAAAADGLQSAVGFPLSVSGRFVGMIECFDRRRRAADSSVLPLLEGVGAMVGTLLDRGLADEERSKLLDQVQTERARLRAVLRQLPFGVIVSDPDGDVVLANDQVRSMLGPPDDNGVYRIRPVSGPSVVPGLVSVARDETTRNDDTKVRAPDGSLISLAISSVPVHGDDGTIVSAVTTLIDVTEQRAHQDHTELLAEAGELFARSLDIDETMAAIISMSVPRLADLCIIDIVEHSGMFRRMGLAAGHAMTEDIVRRIDERYGSEAVASGVGTVLHTGTPLVHPEIADQDLEAAAVDQEHLELLGALRLRSVAIVPLAGRGRVLGAMTFATVAGRRMSRAASDLAVELGRRAGLAVANARLYQDARQVADALQTSLLPPTLPEVSGLDIAARFIPGGDGLLVGGDFYDVYEVGDDRWAFAVGDVCGKGAEAAAVTARVRYTARAAPERNDPVALLGRLNDLLMSELGGNGRFCTLVHGVCEVGDSGVAVTLASGGHPPPLLVRADGRISAVPCRGSLIGLLKDVFHDPADLTLRNGDSIVLFTDGVTEARDASDFFGERRLWRAVGDAAGGTADEMVSAVCDAVLAHTGGVATDDIAVLVIRSTVPDATP